MVLGTKKDGSTQCCVGYRHFNKITVKGAYHLARIDDAFNILLRKRWLSMLDLASGYSFSNDARGKTAADGLLQGLCWLKCIVYLDIIISFVVILHLVKLLYQLSQYSLQLKSTKCDLYVPFLRYIVGRERFQCDPTWIEDVKT